MFNTTVVWDRYVERLHRLYIRLYKRQATTERQFFAGQLSDQEYLDRCARQQSRLMRIVMEYKRYCQQRGLSVPPGLGRPL